MSNRFISTFFAIVFTLFITTPMVITVLEKSFDVSLYFSCSEEEKTENETQKTLKLISLEANKPSSLVVTDFSKIVAMPYASSYTQLFSEETSPPPEQPIV